MANVTDVVIERTRSTAAKVYTWSGEDKPAKLPPQAQYVWYALAQLESGTVAEIAEKAVELGMTTRQDPERIVAYYLPTLRERGALA